MLTESFFNRSSVKVAKDLVGCFLCTPTGKFRIVETESYEGPQDMASHASRGETERNKPMFGKAGVWYVYFTYGMHYMLNIVCGPSGFPSAVLIRGIEGALGPARLTKKLGIDKRFNNRKMSKSLGLWIEARDQSGKVPRIPKLKILRTPRIGVAYAGPVWSKKLYRFVAEGYETKKF